MLLLNFNHRLSFLTTGYNLATSWTTGPWC